MAKLVTNNSKNAEEPPQGSSSNRAVNIPLISEQVTAPVTITATRELALLLVLTKRINNRYEQEFDLSFNSILLALFVVFILSRRSNNPAFC